MFLEPRTRKGQKFKVSLSYKRPYLKKKKKDYLLISAKKSEVVDVYSAYRLQS